ncbi:MAG: class IV adenylate cyclase [Candidatus Abyssobacteria bacterium SURF_17]|uniref:Class IV adenylate cyclase n=1 Tax=Candidatus Abyssobacteria bacterium SURF_17 TaxID=2093361 RepID=A0A419EZM0_9BACT|nr:MAG: class IV adenylate cyclase [Candidatus Abyssubacteria bacterium SURF_17]
MEIEAKVRPKNLSKLRSSLKSAGAVFKGRGLEKNWLFDHPEQALAATDKLLRLREDIRVSLTFKGPRQNSQFKKREEIEIEFPDTSSARSLLEAVGFIHWFYYEKFRETWKLGSATIVVDELPQLGVFVEVEAETDAEVEAVVRKLKLPRKYISSTYVELLVESAKQTQKYTGAFRFPPEYESVLGFTDADSK